MCLSCLGPANEFSINNSSGKDSAGLLLASEDTAGNIIDYDRVVSCTSDFGDGSCESSIQGGHCGEEASAVQGRIAREPIDRSRYVVVNGSSGTVFVCARCRKQYIHRKSLNKHWNDKHTDDSTDSGKYLASRACSLSHALKNPFNVELSTHMALSCNSSLLRSAVHSYAGCSPTSAVVPITNSQQKTYCDMHRSRIKDNSSITDSVLWHSLAAIHLNQERDLNSFYCAPMPAHIGRHHNARESFLNQLFYDDDCQVLDLSKGSSDLNKPSNVPVPDHPIDLSNKMCLAGSEEVALPLRGVIDTGSKSVASCCAEVSAVDSLILNKPRIADKWVARFGDSMKDSKPVQLNDSVAVLRRLHSGVVTIAANESAQGDSGCCSVVAFVSDELKSDYSEVQPSAKYKCDHNSMHFKMYLKNNLNVIAKPPDDLATSKETHDFFGGISRGGHIRCKLCEFSATSMLLFSRHVARHVRKPSISGDEVEDRSGDGVDKKYRFFMWLGLHRTSVADVENELRSNDRCHYTEVDSLETDEDSKRRCKPVVTDADECMPEVQANGIRSHLEGECGEQQKDNSGDRVRQKRGYYQRGLGLTTTESRDAAGRSWRRRRLRTCERCGYVTDNLTTLKRHEEKHGALGMYRCRLCDYTVNQQHILEYHMRNVHGLSRQIGSENVTLLKYTNIPLINNIVDEHGAITATTLVGDCQASLIEDLPHAASTADSAFQGGCAAFTCRSQVHSIRYIANKYSMRKAMRKIMQHPTPVTLARHHLLSAFGLQLGHGICVCCGFRSLSSVRMKRHMLQHPHERHACALCPHTSPTAQLLLKHKRQHTDCKTGYLAQKKAYPCPECPFVAASPNRLQCHTQFHGVKLRHVCGKCSYSVDRANLMAQHRRLHASVSTLTTAPARRWLYCSKCPFKTINRVILVSHERGHYAINCRYMCSLCSFGTDVANVALGHQRLHSCITSN